MELGHVFRSETDSEVIAHLIDEMYEGNLEDAVAAALMQVEGTYGIAVVSSRDPNKLVAARNGSPLLLGLGDGGTYFVASDAAAIVEHTRDVVYLGEGELAVMDREGYRMLDLKGRPLEKEVSRVTWDLETIEKGGFAHYMLKEIFEQPDSVRDTMRGRLLEEEGGARLGGLSRCLPWQEIENFNRIVLTACGTSWHAALIGEYMLEEFARLPVETEYASEFRYRNPVLDPRSLVIAISQSGETADTLAAQREAKSRGSRGISIVNVVGSTIARESDCGVYIHAGPEIGVASTKAFTSQVTAFALFSMYFGRSTGVTQERGHDLVAAMKKLPDQISEILDRNDEIREMAKLYHHHRNFLYLGRGYNFPVALEGALKLKEISYLHAEGFSAAEMKHGPIALIDENMPVVVVAPRDGAYAKVLSNMQEVKARGGHLVAITTEPNGLAELADECFIVPPTIDALLPVITSIPLQLLAYHIGVKRGCDVDKPRNLAKSVTVE
jgi:glutamine---fructose-6-phosphate transaminase (isomerizing)